MAPGFGNLIDSDLGNPLHRAVFQTIVHHIGDGQVDTVPTWPEDPGRHASGESSDPLSRKDLVVVRQPFFSRFPGKGFGMYPMKKAVHTARWREGGDFKIEEWEILKVPGQLDFIPGIVFPAFSAERPPSISQNDLDHHNILLSMLLKKDISQKRD